MDKRTNPKKETVARQSPIGAQRPTSTGWEELAAKIAAGHRITMTCTRNGEVIETFEFNGETKPETPPERPAPVVEGGDQEPTTAPQARGAAKVAAIARNLGAFLRSLTLKDVFLFLFAATFFTGVGLYVLYSLLVIAPFILGLAAVVFAHQIASDMVPDFPGKSVFIMFLILLICANAYAFLMRGG